MLIVSKFHDYYDTAIAYGIDKDCVYSRNTETILKSRYRYHRDFSNKRDTFRLTNHYIGFCGEVYRCIKVEQINYRYIVEDTLVFYDANSILNFLEKNDVELTESKRYRWGSNSISSWTSKEDIRIFFDDKVHKSYYDIFREHNTPIFILNSGEHIINPCLKDYKFGKIKDAFTAFQEIHMYIAGVLGNKEKETLDISDEIRAKQHGYNEWSFKTLPGSKKPRNKKRKS